MPESNESLDDIFGTTPDGSCGGSNAYTCGVVYGNCCSKENQCGSTLSQCGKGWWDSLFLARALRANVPFPVNPSLGPAPAVPSPLSRQPHPRSHPTVPVAELTDTYVKVIPKVTAAVPRASVATRPNIAVQGYVNLPVVSEMTQAQLTYLSYTVSICLWTM
jgi:hypothetical protein